MCIRMPGGSLVGGEIGNKYDIFLFIGYYVSPFDSPSREAGKWIQFARSRKGYNQPLRYVHSYMMSTVAQTGTSSICDTELRVHILCPLALGYEYFQRILYHRRGVLNSVPKPQLNNEVIREV